MVEEEQDVCFTFSDEDFERRYSIEEAAGQADPSHSVARQTNPQAAGRSRNSFMRTLLRRRLAASRLA